MPRIISMGAPDSAVPVPYALARTTHKIVAVHMRPDQPAGQVTAHLARLAARRKTRLTLLPAADTPRVRLLPLHFTLHIIDWQ